MGANTIDRRSFISSVRLGSVSPNTDVFFGDVNIGIAVVGNAPLRCRADRDGADLPCIDPPLSVVAQLPLLDGPATVADEGVVFAGTRAHIETKTSHTEPGIDVRAATSTRPRVAGSTR